MDYEKKYKMALERAQDYLEGHSTDVNPQAAMRYVFPELESKENERIKDRIISVIIAYYGSAGVDYERDECLSWIKKQKVSEWSEEDDEMLTSIIDDTIQEAQLDAKQIDWLRSLRYSRNKFFHGQWKPTDEQMKAMDYAGNIIEEKMGSKYYVFETLREDLRKLV